MRQAGRRQEPLRFTDPAGILTDSGKTQVCREAVLLTPRPLRSHQELSLRFSLQWGWGHIAAEVEAHKGIL